MFELCYLLGHIFVVERLSFWVAVNNRSTINNTQKEFAVRRDKRDKILSHASLE